MATPVDAALAHVNAVLAAIAPAHEGLRDYARMNILRETQVSVATALSQFDRRVAKLTAVKVALEALIAEPDFSPLDIPAAALKDLQENAATVQAALALFTPGAATTLGLSAAAPEPK